MRAFCRISWAGMREPETMGKAGRRRWRTPLWAGRGGHQQLLELLGSLGEGIELSRVLSGRNPLKAKTI